MKPDDKLTNDDAIAPADQYESPHEQPIVHVDPHATLEEDDDAFNEFQMPGEHLDLLHADNGAPAPVGGASDVPTSAAFRPVPGWMIAAGALVLMWAGIYLGTYSGGFGGDVFNEQASYKPTGPTGPVDPVVASRQRGQKLYIANCAQCHQASGLGAAGQFPPLVASEWVVGEAPRRLVQILLHGIQGEINVKGNKYNNAMPPWNAVLKDKQIADILTYIRGELGGNAAGPITEEHMAKGREETKARTDPWTEAELKAIPAGPLDGAAGVPGGEAAKAVADKPSDNPNPANAGPGATKPAAALPGQGPAPQPAPTP